MRIQVEGLQDVLRDLNSMPDDACRAVRHRMKAITDPVVRKAIPLTPQDPETDWAGLVGSIRSIRPQVNKRKLTVTGGVVAGGKMLEPFLGRRTYNVWAIVQHEDLSLRHTKGGGKFVERPFMSDLDRMRDEIEDALEDEMRSHGA